jgi:putative glutamine amidotransferase
MAIIGLTCNYVEDQYRITHYYAKAIMAAGGLPIILPYTKEANIIEAYLDVLDGLLLTGGIDVDPYYYHEEPSPNLGFICPERDAFEFALVLGAFKRKKPILAICRGMQILNIALGGTIWQDINHAGFFCHKHMQEAPKWYPTHEIILETESRLFHILGQQGHLRVNSFHHQAVKDIPPAFRVCARSQDQLIEAIEYDDFYCLGVQWHPECMENDLIQFQLFQSFVNTIDGVG